jgi:hypothetical protein
VGLEKELIKKDNFGRKNGVITLRMDKEDGARLIKSLSIRDVMVSNKKWGSGEKRSRESQP